LSFSKLKPTGKHKHEENPMASITLSDLIQSLRKAASNPEAHSPAQQHYFSKAQDDSVLVNCGSACCIAGDLHLKAHADSSEQELRELINKCGKPIIPGDWVREELGLSDVEATLAFDANTHHEIHELLANLLEQGLRLPDSEGRIEISCESTYTEFDCAYFGYYESPVDLDGVLYWMSDIARKDP
jgi:hypothetical protein